MNRSTRVLVGLAVVIILVILGACDRTHDKAEPRSAGAPTTQLFPILLGAKYGFIDTAGKVVINPQFDGLYDPGGLSYRQTEDPWAEGLAVVCVGHCKYDRDTPTDGKYGFIDTAGKMVINPQFDYARPFVEGLAAVQIGHRLDEVKFGYVDKTGRYVVSPQFALAYSFKEGLAAVCIGDCYTFEGSAKWGYIDQTGKFAINPQFDSAYDFRNGLAEVINGQVYPRAGRGPTAFEREAASPPKHGYIDKTGKFVWGPN